MGILKNREELLPVTCAVLKEEQRKDFFSKAKKQAGGTVEKLAKCCGFPIGTVSDWISGKTHIPYHMLQRLSQELGLELPQVSELRREFQQLPHAVSTKPLNTAIHTSPWAQRTPKPKKIQKPPKTAPNTKVPKLSAQLAYWTGTLFAAVTYEGAYITLKANDSIGENFALAWAKRTQELFGISPELNAQEEKSQPRFLVEGGLADFLEKLGFKPGMSPNSAPGAPRWAWSNPEWKISFLKGSVDACAQFYEVPALHLNGLSAQLSRSIQKMLATLDLPAKAQAGTLSLEGQQALQKYFHSVGTCSAKLEVQLQSCLKNPASAATPVKAAKPHRFIFVGRPKPKH